MQDVEHDDDVAFRQHDLAHVVDRQRYAIAGISEGALTDGDGTFAQIESAQCPALRRRCPGRRPIRCCACLARFRCHQQRSQYSEPAADVNNARVILDPAIAQQRRKHRIAAQLSAREVIRTTTSRSKARGRARNEPAKGRFRMGNPIS